LQFPPISFQDFIATFRPPRQSSPDEQLSVGRFRTGYLERSASLFNTKPNLIFNYFLFSPHTYIHSEESRRGEEKEEDSGQKEEEIRRKG